MPGDEAAVPAQADIIGIPGAAMSTLSLTHGLLRAVSADNVSPQAVIQMERLGSCFHSNGPWAAKVPDLLCRASSVRLERISAWIGWEKNDTASFMSKTTGGKTTSLLCCVLGSLYDSTRCGMLLYALSESILPSEQQIASPNQLGGVCKTLEAKLACLGFGNHFAVQATRLRQCFFEAGLAIPQDLIETPTEEDIQTFLCSVRDALQDENLILQVTGTRCLATLLAAVLAICPDDVSVQVNGEILMTGSRDKIVFHVTGEHGLKTEFHVESRFRPQTVDFAKSYITLSSVESVQSPLRFTFDNMLSDWLDLTLEITDDSAKQSLKQAIANVVACTASSLTRKQLQRYWSTQSSRDYCLQGEVDQWFPAQGIQTILGPTYRQVISDRLQKVICPPSNTSRPLSDELEILMKAIHDKPLSTAVCTCRKCKKFPEPLYLLSVSVDCPMIRLQKVVSQVTYLALLCVFIKCGRNSTTILLSKHFYPMDFLASLWSMARKPESRALPIPLLERIKDKMEAPDRFLSRIHDDIMDLFGNEQWSNTVCSSSSASTVYPSTLKCLRITNPWTVYYEAVDGRLWFRSDIYGCIVSGNFRPDEHPRRPSVGNEHRPPIAKEAVTRSAVAAPSALGQHTSLSMTLRPTTKFGGKLLQLRCVVTQSTHVFELDFLNLHFGLMNLTPADPCGHALSKPLTVTNFVRATSVANPSAMLLTNPIERERPVRGVTLTHLDGESQFLSCSSHWKQLYQGDCCMPCAVGQAKRERYYVIIGGSPSTYRNISTS